MDHDLSPVTEHHLVRWQAKSEFERVPGRGYVPSSLLSTSGNASVESIMPPGEQYPANSKATWTGVRSLRT